MKIQIESVSELGLIKILLTVLFIIGLYAGTIDKNSIKGYFSPDEKQKLSQNPVNFIKHGQNQGVMRMLKSNYTQFFLWL